MNRSLRWQRFFIILFVSFVTIYASTDALYNHPQRYDNDALMVADIVEGRAPAPFAYRLLVPYILYTAGNTLAVHLAWYAVTLSIFYMLLWTWAARWNARPIAAVALAALVFQIMLATFHYGSYSTLEWILWLAGLLLITGKNRQPESSHLILYGLLIAVGTLNRETTGLLLGLSWVALYPRRIRLHIVYAFIAVVVYLGVRYGVGYLPRSYSFETILAINLGDTLPRVIILNSILAPLWLALLVRIRSMPDAPRRLALFVLPIYLLLFVRFTMWQEVRLLMPILIIGVAGLHDASLALSDTERSDAIQSRSD
jgi:hypothetical protein